MQIKTTPARRVFMVCNYVILTITAACCLLPFINLLAVSFSESSAVAAGDVTFWPVGFTLDSYKFVASSDKFLRAFVISIIRVILGVAVNMLMMVITAYPLSRDNKQLAGRNIYAWFFVITMLVGGGLIPTYLVIVKTGLINSIWALILPGALPVYNMVILLNFFRELPKELEEAARIDGASFWSVLWKIILPVSKPALATVGLFCIVSHWNSWFDGLIYMNTPRMYPLQSYLQTMIMNPEQMLQAAGSDYTKLLAMVNARTSRAAQLFLGALPILCVYPFLQKYFTTGLVMGSVKG
ncbi:MAG TPA: carbohydrate ABC transporter permease [Candidatus Merdivicinus excrementipullorum]|uniref:Carbohydrate ABC transporter permease n=1 Tax=Candidatus Merdivicinus excrementipullorum TaxID=2840867 RepID=A0A9D1FKN6_9FIRM|nr:carbohydrate ABC transporter permease [Candidatus Merdivicinus excrementipullorum]